MKTAKIILFTILLLVSTTAQAKPFWVPTFNKGDAISAEVFNAIFARIKKAQSLPTSEDLVGDWQCHSTIQANPQVWTAEAEAVGWEISESGLYLTVDTTITFTESMISTDGLNPFVARNFNATPINTQYELVDNALFFVLNVGSGSEDFVQKYEVQSIDGGIKLSPAVESGGSGRATLTCQKENDVPLPPSDLAAEVSGGTVALSWQSGSDDSDSFTVYRRSESGEFEEVGTTTETSYSDAPGTGIFFYKVTATNENGESDVGGVVRVEIE